jgi:hypothetical protein
MPSHSWGSIAVETTTEHAVRCRSRRTQYRRPPTCLLPAPSNRSSWYSPRMPIKTYTGGASFPVDTADDVTALVELLGRAATDNRLRNDLGDHFAYVAGVFPEWFRPHQEAVVTQFFDGFDVTFDNLCVLLNGAPANCAEHLERRLRNRWSFRDAWALAAIGTEPALTAIADLVRDGADAKEFEDSGVWTPSTGPAQYRFSPHRRAVELRSASGPSEPATADHPVGLPLDQIVRHPDATAVVWHLRVTAPRHGSRHAGRPGAPGEP